MCLEWDLTVTNTISGRKSAPCQWHYDTEQVENYIARLPTYAWAPQVACDSRVKKDARHVWIQEDTLRDELTGNRAWCTGKVSNPDT